MTVRYDEPNAAARAGNELIRWLAEAGISIAGTRALRVRGRKTGKPTRRRDQPPHRGRPRLRRVAARQHAVGAQRACRGGRRDGSALAQPGSAHRGSRRRRQATAVEELSRSVVLGRSRVTSAA